MNAVKRFLQNKLRGRLLKRALSLESRGRYSDAVGLYDRIGVVGRTGDPECLVTDIECLVRKALVHSHTGDHQLSTETARRLINLLSGIRDQFCRNRLAWAHLFLAEELAYSGHFVEGMNEYDALITRFGFDDDAGIEEYVAEGLVRKGQDLAEHGRNGDYALRCFNDVLKRFDATCYPKIQEHVAEARYWKAATLAKLGDLPSALTHYQAVVELYGTNELPSLRNIAGRALFGWAVAGADERDEQENIEAYEKVVFQFADSQDPEIRSIVGQAYGSLGTIHSSAERWDEAINAFAAMAAHLYGLEEDVDRENFLWALCLMGETLAVTGRLDEALQTFDQVTSAYDDAKRPVGHHLIAATLLAQGAILGSLGRIQDELRAYETIRQRFGSHDGFIARNVLAYATVNSIVALRRLGRVDEAHRLDAELLAEYQGATDPEIRVALDLACRNRNCEASAELERFEVETCSSSSASVGYVKA